PPAATSARTRRPPATEGAPTASGPARARGSNRLGQLGNGTKTGYRAHSNVPVQVWGLTGAVAVAGGVSHSLAMRSDGTVWAWGRNGFGQLGDGTTTGRNVPVRVSGLRGAAAVAGGGHRRLAVRSVGTVAA